MRIFQSSSIKKSPTAMPAKERPILPAGDEGGEGEGKLEEWLNASPDAILDERLLLFARQPSLPTGEADLIGLDRFGNCVVVEIKMGTSGSKSASEASIVSQPQLYAQALDRFSYHDLDALREEYVAKGCVVPSEVAQQDSLIGAFNSFFDKDRDPWELNQGQRMVIVAERITPQTRQSTRWLRDQGLDIQAVELQRFDLPSGETCFGAVTIVDYDETRSRQPTQSKPGDRVFTIGVFTKAFPHLQDILSTDHMDSVLGNLTTNYPYLESRAPGHPNAVRYALRVNPYGDNEVKVAIDASGDGSSSAVKTIQKHRNRFEERNFLVSDRESLRIVVDTWENIEIADLRRDAFIERVAARYIELVELSHTIFDST
ncbi:hypothetical protein [Halalkalirubrum salinum]|uniref:hypothetical protein n=1 Tax=Halalkalirubrum salinum TaxID=2563889 RepID=UPI0010FB2CA6|nr:hypothetical protein [Halalkalirubrum salinum]